MTKLMPYSPTSLSTSYFNFILPDFSVSFWCDSARNLLVLIDGVFRAQARARGQEQDRWRPNHAENEAFGGMEEENGEEERSRQMRGRHTWDLPRLEQNQLHCFISSYFGDEPSPPVLFHPSTSLTEADSAHCTKIKSIREQQEMELWFLTANK